MKKSHTQFPLTSQLKQLFSIANAHNYFKTYRVVFTFKTPMNLEWSFIMAAKCSRLARKTLMTRGCLYRNHFTKSVKIFMPILWLRIFNEMSLLSFYHINCLILLNKLCITF